jgi:hypothetical protein
MSDDSGRDVGGFVLGNDYGWPWPYQTKCVEYDDFGAFYWLGLAGDVAVGLAILIAVNVVLENLLRAVSLHSRRNCHASGDEGDE